MMTKEDLNFIVKGVVETLEKTNLEKRNKTASEYFKEGLFRFVIPGIILFIAGFFSFQRTFELFKVETDNSIENLRDDVTENKIDIEKGDISFEGFVKEYYKLRVSNNSKGSKN